MTTALHPFHAGLAEVIHGRAGVGRLLFVVVPVAPAVVGDAPRVLDLQTPAQNIERMDPVVPELAVAPMPKPMPVVMDVRLHVPFARHGALPKIHVDVGGRLVFALADGGASVVIKRAAKTCLAQGTAVQR